MSNPFTRGMTRLQIPDGMGDVLSIGGFTLKADKDRCIEVPQEFVKDLRAQGLTDPVGGTLSLPNK